VAEKNCAEGASPNTVFRSPSRRTGGEAVTVCYVLVLLF